MLYTLYIKHSLVSCFSDIIEEEDDEQFQEELEKDNENSIGEVTLRQRQRVMSFSPREVRTTARRVALSKNARMRIRASMVIPGASEGVLPPDAKPVTTQEALHHLAKRVMTTVHSTLL